WQIAVVALLLGNTANLAFSNSVSAHRPPRDTGDSGDTNYRPHRRYRPEPPAPAPDNSRKRHLGDDTNPHQDPPDPTNRNPEAKNPDNRHPDRGFSSHSLASDRDRRWPHDWRNWRPEWDRRWYRNWYPCWATYDNDRIINNTCIKRRT